jgi:DNA-binding CsgD family transcriptional regulator
MVEVGHDPANVKLYAQHYFAVDPGRAATLAAPALTSFTAYEHFPKRVRERHEYFDFMRRIEVGDVIGVSTPEHGGRRSVFSLQRPLGVRGFDADEKTIIELLASHVALAKRVQQQLGAAWSGRSELEAAFGKVAVPAFVVDRYGHVRHLNPAAESLMARCAGVAVRSGKLLFSDARAGSAVYAALRIAASDGGRAAAVPVAVGQEAGEVLVTPLQPREGAAREPLALVLVASAPDDERVIAWRVRELYGLTPAEAAITAALALGRSVEDVAKAKRVSLATLRSHLRSIFAKTGTRRQAELVSIALRGSAIRP